MALDGQLSARIPADQHEYLRRRARETGTAVADVVRALIDEARMRDACVSRACSRPYYESTFGVMSCRSCGASLDPALQERAIG